MSTHNERIALWLRHHELFGILSDAERLQLVSKAHLQSYSDGEIIFQQGDEGASLFLVIQGQVRILLGTEDGKGVLISTIESGEFLGEMALLDGESRSANAEAKGHCELLIIHRKDFLSFLSGSPDSMLRLIKILCQRLRHTNTLLEMIALQNLPVRLARYLLQLAKTCGKQTPNGLRIHSGMNQTDLGEHIAVSRESINKQLKAWEERGIVTLMQGGDILLRNPAMLQDISFRNGNNC